MRWLRFNAVGAMGAALQLALLALLVHVVGMHYLWATALSVEAAILHNFLWHRRWTWADRRGASDGAAAALARFNLTNGLVSISGNLLSAYLDRALEDRPGRCQPGDHRGWLARQPLSFRPGRLRIPRRNGSPSEQLSKRRAEINSIVCHT
ncbi:MAG: GtrA family protein [Acidobacteriia bacterium]|nr:GtrA family protein [Terriglobia bacterium]